MSRTPNCLDNRFTDGGYFVSLTRRPHSTPHKQFLVIISFRGWVDPRAIVRLEILGKLRKRINDLIGTRTRDLPAWNKDPQPYTLPRSPYLCIYKNTSIYVIWSPLWSSGQSSWLQIQRSGFDFRCYQIFWQVVGLERVPLSLVSTIKELLGRKSSDSGLESREYGRRDPSRWPRDTLYPQKLTLTSSTSGGRSVSILRSRIKATEFSLYVYIYYI
jgi:hypothetical protein